MRVDHGPRLRILSLGAGKDSTALALLALEGALPPLDCAIFADTRWEPVAVRAQLRRISDELRDAGVPVYRVSNGDLRADHLNAESPFSSMPLFVRGDDGKERLGRRQCTHDYKLRPVREKTRELLGFPKPARVSRGVYAETWVGFNASELGRVNSNRSPAYARLRFPLVELGMTRRDVERYLETKGPRWAQTAKSACIGCPFHGNAYWRDMRDNRPAEWADAVAFDRAIRQAPRGKRSGMRGEQFLHRSLLPLDQAPIDRVSRTEWRGRQVDLFDVLEQGDPDGCSPYGCRSGAPAA